MLSVNRYDATAPQGYESDGPVASSSRLTALAAKKRKREEDGSNTQTQQLSASASQPPIPSSSAHATATPTSTGGAMPFIHPSRLASAPILAQSMKKAAQVAGVPKEKTKAKQRYLNKKKLKRKNKKKAKAPSSAVQGANGPTTPAKARPDDEEDSSSEEEENVTMDTTLADTSTALKASASKDSDSSSSSSSESESEDEDPHVSMGEPIAGQPIEQPIVDDEALIVPLARSKPVITNTPEALKLLAAQGLPRGMVEPTIVDPALRKAVEAPEQAETAQDGAPGSVVESVLDATMTSRVKEMGIVEWFAVQTAVIPHLLKTSAHPSPFAPPRDLCVSAPTGSGKTLAYSIPIVSLLKSRVIIRLRALIILPTRDLVSQVRETIEQLAKGTTLRIGSTSGAQTFPSEQALLIDEATGENKLDILVTTPGRLIAHLDETEHFTLKHLRFLVIDEADRLLGQSFNDWAQRLRSSIDEADTSSSILSSVSSQYPFALDPLRPSSMVQKLLFSATLTSDPGKLSELSLRDPVFIDVRDQQTGQEESTSSLAHYTLPATLDEHMLVVPTSLKPLHLLHLLANPPTGAPLTRSLIFTKSVDSANRLMKLLELFFSASSNSSSTPVLRCANYSSDLSPSARRSILTHFKADQLDVLVCSDLISRGIDLPTVENVISYDVPIDAAKYVHRVGRTARAGLVGNAWTLVEEQEARWFKKLVVKSGIVKRGKGIKKVKVGEGEMEGLRERYEEALRKLVSGKDA